jgi:hypothetical protein
MHYANPNVIKYASRSIKCSWRAFGAMQWADVKESIVKIVLGRGSGFFLYPVRVANHFPQLKSVHLTILLILPFIYIFEGILH